MSSARARNSRRADCQESRSAAQREQLAACSPAAARCASFKEASRPASKPMDSNSSHVISHSLNLQKACRLAICAPQRFSQHFELGHQKSAPAMQPRTNRANGTPNHLRSFFVTPFFEFAEDYGFAKLSGKIQDRRANLFDALAFLRLASRSGRLYQNNSRTGAVFVLFLERDFPWQALEMLQHTIARDAVQKSAHRRSEE